MKQNTIELEKNYHFQTYNRYPITLVKGKGCKVYDSEGKEYIDALAGIGVVSTGHCHPAVVGAIKEQAEKLMHCSNLFYNEPQSRLADKLSQMSGFDRVFFCNSGAEAVEGAIKLARKYANKSGRKGPILSCTNGFHGRTLAAVALGKDKYKSGFEPMPAGFGTIPFNDIDGLNKIDKETTAVIIEPIQGEGGVIPASKEFLKALGEKCNETGALLIFDEIQCGIGRTGEFLAYQYFDVKPDIITIAKALGGGFPIGAILAKDEIAKAFQPGNHGSTFGGNPLACAAANAVLDSFNDESIIDNAKLLGVYFLKELKSRTTNIANIKDIRGAGLMLGIELDFKCSEVIKVMLDKGVIANCASDYTIRLLPPLVISKEEVDKIIDILIESILEVAESS